MGILIGPLILKELFIFSEIFVNNKISDQKCKDGFLSNLSSKKFRLVNERDDPNGA
jgi:hypothetical protein